MAVPVGHAAVERAGIAVKDQRQEIFVALPHGQFLKPRHRMPQQLSLGVLACGRALVSGDEKDETHYSDRKSVV